MSLRSWLGGMLRGAPLPQPRPGSGFSNSLLWLSKFPVDANPIRSRTEQLSAYVGWANAAVNRIALDIRSTPRMLWKKTGKGREDWDVVEEIPPVLQRPNSVQTMGELLHTTAMHLDLTGEAYWHLITDNRGNAQANPNAKVIGLQSIYPHWIGDGDILQDENGTVTGWRVTVPGRVPRFIPASEMVFLRYPHPSDPLRGASPVEAYAITHDMDTYARAYGGSLLKNRATPELVISVESEITPEQSKLIQNHWMDKYRDPANGPAVLGQGSKVQQLGLSIKDLGFLELTGATREMILGIYSMPAAILGLTTDFNRANADTARATYEQNCLAPRLGLIEEALNLHVVPRVMGKDATSLWFGFEEPSTEDRDYTLRQADSALRNGAIKLNEYREKLGYDGIGEEGDVFYIPMGVNVVSSIDLVTDEEPEPVIPPADTSQQIPPPGKEDPSKPTDPKAPSNDDDPEEKPAKEAARYMGEIRELIANLPVVRKADETKPLKMRAAKAEFLERQGKLERSLKSEIRKLFSKEQAAIIARLKKEGVRALSRSIETRDWTDDELEEHTKEWEATLREFFLRGMREGWLLASADIGRSIDWNLYSKQAEKFARQMSATKVTAISKTTRDGVRRVIGDGIASGATIDQMSDDLRRLYDGFKGYRAELISRTESSASTNFGKTEFARDAEERLDLKLVKTWVSVQDERTREDHANADGQTVPRDQPFDIGGFPMDAPGDPTAPVELVANCRCTTTWAADE
jgi:HK97 family phage portal protein